MQHQRPHPTTVPRPTGPKPTLQMVHLPVYRVKQRHLEAYLARVYRMEKFDFLIASGATPGMCPEYRVSPTLPPAWESRQEADRIRHGRHVRNMPFILNVLCLDGYIPAGVYIIDTHPEPAPSQVYRALLVKTENPSHPDCVAFKHSHQHNRAFRELAARMDNAVREQKAPK